MQHLVRLPVLLLPLLFCYEGLGRAWLQLAKPTEAPSVTITVAPGESYSGTLDDAIDGDASAYLLEVRTPPTQGELHVEANAFVYTADIGATGIDQFMLRATRRMPTADQSANADYFVLVTLEEAVEPQPGGRPAQISGGDTSRQGNAVPAVGSEMPELEDVAVRELSGDLKAPTIVSTQVLYFCALAGSIVTAVFGLLAVRGHGDRR